MWRLWMGPVVWLWAACASPGEEGGGAWTEPNPLTAPWVEERWPLPMVVSSLDVLFVVQDSCCVDAEVGELLLGWTQDGGAFDILVREGVDTRMGVITTDAENPVRSGRLVEVDGQRFVDLAEPGARGRIAAMMNVGRNGDPDERGLRALNLALQEPLRSEWNVGFRREEAALQVVVISDADDQSGQEPGVDEIVARLRDLQPDPDLLSFSAIVGTTDTCIQADPAPRYLEVVRRLRGVAVDLCDDLARRGGSVVTDLLAPPPEFFLRYVPYLPSFSMVVHDRGSSYAGVLWEQDDELVDHCVTESCFMATWDPVRNSVRSEEYRIPRGEGNEVTVRYQRLSDADWGEL